MSERGAQRTVDFTTGPVLGQMARFSVPLIIGNLFQQLYTIVDSILLGRMVSPQALAAASTVTPIVMLMLSAISGLTMGTSLVTAALKGEGRADRVRRLVESTFGPDMLVGALMALAALLFPRAILRLIRVPGDVFALSERYLRIIAVGIVFQCLYQYLSDVLRGLGDSRTPLMFLLFSTGLNIVLDIAFIVVLRMDVEGVAIATVISQAISAGLCTAYSRRKYDCFLLNLRPDRVDRALLRRSLRLGLPTAMQQMVGSVGAVCMQSVVNRFGSVAMNGYGSAYKVDNFIILPVSNMGVALGTFVAQNVGAGKYTRAKEGLRTVSLACAVLSLVMSMAIYLLAEPLVALFVSAREAETVALGARGLRILAVPYLLCSQLALMISFFRGAGAVRVTFWCALAQVGVRLSICYGLSPVIGLDAVWFSMPATWVIFNVFSFFYYRSQSWEARWERGLRA